LSDDFPSVGSGVDPIDYFAECAYSIKRLPPIIKYLELVGKGVVSVDRFEAVAKDSLPTTYEAYIDRIRGAYPTPYHT
jgi:hypothetical protein